MRLSCPHAEHTTRPHAYPPNTWYTIVVSCVRRSRVFSASAPELFLEFLHVHAVQQPADVLVGVLLAARDEVFGDLADGGGESADAERRLGFGVERALDVRLVLARDAESAGVARVVGSVGEVRGEEAGVVQALQRGCGETGVAAVGEAGGELTQAVVVGLVPGGENVADAGVVVEMPRAERPTASTSSTSGSSSASEASEAAMTSSRSTREPRPTAHRRALSVRAARQRRNAAFVRNHWKHHASRSVAARAGASPGGVSKRSPAVANRRARSSRATSQRASLSTPRPPSPNRR